MVGLSDCKKIFEDMYNRSDIIPACGRRTDRQTSCHGIVRAMHTRRAVKIKRNLTIASRPAPRGAIGSVAVRAAWLR